MGIETGSEIIVTLCVDMSTKVSVDSGSIGIVIIISTFDIVLSEIWSRIIVALCENISTMVGGKIGTIQDKKVYIYICTWALLRIH